MFGFGKHGEREYKHRGRVRNSCREIKKKEQWRLTVTTTGMEGLEGIQYGNQVE
jgi:hypothetical protein